MPRNRSSAAPLLQRSDNLSFGVFIVQNTNGVTRTVQIEPEGRTVADLLKLTTEAFGLDLVPYHQIKIASSKEALSNSTALNTIDVAERAHLRLDIHSDAPIIHLVPLSPADQTPKIIKKANSERLLVLDQRGRSLLHLCAEYCTRSLTYLLTKKKIFDVNQKDNGGNTPLMYATASGDIQRVKALIQAGAQPLLSNYLERNCLHSLCSKAVSISSQDFIELLKYLDQCGLHVNMRDAEGNTSAHLAASSGNNLALKYFVEQMSFHVDTVNSSGETCLHFATKFEKLNTVKALLEMKASKYVVDMNGEFPLDIAQARGLTEIACLLSGDLETRLINRVWELIKEGDLEQVKEVNSKYRERETGVTDTQVAQQLQRSSSNQISWAGMSSRRFRSTQNLYEEMPYQRILNAGILWSAARFKFDILDHLLDQPAANPRFQNSDGSFLLLVLVRCGFSTYRHDPRYLAVLEKAVKIGASVNDKDPDGNTCLHIAGLYANRPAARFLLDNGAFTNTVDSKGHSELFFATLGGNEFLVNDYLCAGSDPLICLRNGTNCIGFAKQVGRANIATLLETHVQTEAESQAAFFQPNSVVVTLKCGRNLLPKDDNGLSDPYCIFRHRLDNLQIVTKSEIKFETLNPEWNQSFRFIIKKDLIYHRDIQLEVYDFDEVEEGEMQNDDFIGRTVLVVDPREKRNEISLQLQDQEGKAGTIEVSLKYEQLTPEEIKEFLDTSYHVYDVLKDVQEMLKGSRSRSVGAAKAAFGFKPRYPIMIIPGLASSALECWESPKNWIRERVWIDPFKIGRTAVAQKLATKIQSKKKSRKTKDLLPEDVDDLPEVTTEQRIWLRHILLDPDGFSDPPGIKVRPATGLTAVDFLATHPLARKASYVFGNIIPELVDVGYLPKNLDAAPYDWRLPPEKLEERDGYFTSLKARIEVMRKVNNERVVLMAHSMGNRCVQYFLEWIRRNYDVSWIDENIHAFLALGPPFLGAPKTVRAVISGDCMGLEMFLTMEEARTMARGSASLPWLFPIQEDLFPDTIAHILQNSPEDSVATPDTPSKKETRRKKKSSSSKLDDLFYKEMDVQETLEFAAPTTLEYLDRFYTKNPLFWANFSPNECEEAGNFPPIILPPPVKNLWVVYGINLDTEVSYYFRPHKTIKDRLVLDPNSDKFSGKKIAGVNPRGMRISGGTGYETKNTYQPSARANKSGDGTVPYCSLNFAAYWQEYAERHGIPMDVQIIEVEGAEHREMLYHDAVFDIILKLVCSKPIG